MNARNESEERDASGDGDGDDNDNNDENKLTTKTSVTYYFTLFCFPWLAALGQCKVAFSGFEGMSVSITEDTECGRGNGRGGGGGVTLS